MGGGHDHEFRLGWVPERCINWTYTNNDPFYSASLSYNGGTISFGQGVQHNVGLFDSAGSVPDWSHELEGRQFEQVMSDDGRYFISSNHVDGTRGSWSGFALWNTLNPEPIWEFHICEETDSKADAVDMDRDARYVVGGCSQNMVYLFSQFADGNPGWDTKDGNPVFTYTTDGRIRYNSISITADGTYFTVGSYDGSVYLFSTIGEPHLVWSWNSSFSAPASVEYSWDFSAAMDSDGDGDFTNDGDFLGSNPTHVYEKDGNYTVTLTLTAEDGAVYIHKMLVTVDLEDPDSWQETLLEPGLPLTAVAILAAFLVCSFAGGTEVGKYRLIPFISPLYSRLKKEEVLDHLMRSRIFEHIIKNPGDHYNSIKQELGLNNGSLAYHLRTLEKEEFIKSRRDGIYKRFYPTGMAIPEKPKMQPSPMEEEIIEMVEKNPGIIQKEIAKALKLSQQLVSYHVNLMIDSGLLSAERHGKTFRYFQN
jgi:DNA-binding MarR family transcriptional regulator